MKKPAKATAKSTKKAVTASKLKDIPARKNPVGGGSPVREKAEK